MLYAIIAVLILIADQWVKYWTTVNIVLDTGEAALIPGFLKLVNVHNTGAAFGFLGSMQMRWVFILIAVAFVIALIVLIATKAFPGKFATWCFTLAMAGAIGNCIDRFLFGYVVDMFKPEFINFAVFNVADVFLVISCILFIFYLIFGNKRGEKVEVEEVEEKPKKRRGRKNKAEAEVEEDVEEASSDVDEDETNDVEEDIEDEDDEDDLSATRIVSAFAVEDEPQPIVEENLPDEEEEEELEEILEEESVDESVDELIEELKEEPVEELVEEPEEELVEEPAEEPVQEPVEEPVEEPAEEPEEDENSYKINNAFRALFMDTKEEPAPVKKETRSEPKIRTRIKEEPAPEPVKSYDTEELFDLDMFKDSKKADSDFDDMEFSLDSILDEFK